MDIKVISRSSKCVPGRPELPQTVQVVCRFQIDGQKVSVTKHLHWMGKNYVGRGYGETKLLRFPTSILNGTVKLGDERLAA
jgi:hypothetical protein